MKTNTVILDRQQYDNMQDRIKKLEEYKGKSTILFNISFDEYMIKTDDDAVEELVRQLEEVKKQKSDFLEEINYLQRSSWREVRRWHRENKI